MNRNFEKGFTLIELVVVIVILGILAATALPRFVNLTDDANKSSFDAVRGNFVSSINMIHMAAIVERQKTGAFPTTLAIEGATVNILVASGWPLAIQPKVRCDTMTYFDSPAEEWLAVLQQLPRTTVLGLLGVSSAHAGTFGGADDTGPLSCTLLELILRGNTLNGWTQFIGGGLVTFTSPDGRAFSYNHLNGEVLVVP